LALEATKVIGRAFWFLGMASLGAWLAVMSLDDQPPYVYNANQSFIIPDPAPQGAMVTVEWALTTVRRECPGSVQRTFRDLDTGRIVTVLDTTPMSRSVRQGDKRLPRSFELPPDLPARVGYSAKVCAQCNLLQHVFPMCFNTPEITFRTIQPRF
jgi:hypothetical protein